MTFNLMEILILKKQGFVVDKKTPFKAYRRQYCKKKKISNWKSVLLKQIVDIIKKFMIFGSHHTHLIEVVLLKILIVA